jgi:hypothetical protein
MAAASKVNLAIHYKCDLGNPMAAASKVNLAIHYKCDLENPMAAASKVNFAIIISVTWGTPWRRLAR